jgi:hypothetical protein
MTRKIFISGGVFELFPEYVRHVLIASEEPAKLVRRFCRADVSIHHLSKDNMGFHRE